MNEKELIEKWSWKTLENADNIEIAFNEVWDSGFKAGQESECKVWLENKDVMIREARAEGFKDGQKSIKCMGCKEDIKSVGGFCKFCMLKVNDKDDKEIKNKTLNSVIQTIDEQFEELEKFIKELNKTEKEYDTQIEGDVVKILHNPRFQKYRIRQDELRTLKSKLNEATTKRS